MPIYQFLNPKTQEVVEVIQKMKDPHVYVDEDGLEWKRIWEAPNASIDSQINAESQRDFLRKTENKHMTVGDIMDQSKEMSEHRAKLHGGRDPVQRKYFDDWSKKRKGKPHPNDPMGGKQ